MNQPSQQSGLPDPIASMLAYLFFVPAVVFLALEPFNQRPLIRFHCFQSIFLMVAGMGLQFALRVVSVVFGHFVFAMLPLWTIVELGLMAAWLICVIQALQGRAYRLPLLGDLAAQQAGL